MASGGTVVGMSSRQGRHRTNMELPVEVKDAMKECDEPMWKVVDKAVRMYMGMDQASTEHALDRRIDELEERVESLEDEIDQKQREKEEALELLEELKDKREQIREKKESHRERLDNILDEMLNQQQKVVMAWMSELKEAATEEYGDPSSSNIERVVGDLRTRRDERNLAIPDNRFRRSAGAMNHTLAQTDGADDTPAWKEDLLNDDGFVEGDD